MENKVNVYPVPTGAVLQKDYIVKVRPQDGEWQELSCFQVKVDMHDVREASMVYFDFEGRVEVEITFPKFYHVYDVKIHPLARKIEAAAEAKRVSFFLDRPENLVVEINKDRFHCLHIFAGAMEEVPKKCSENMLVMQGSLERPCFLGDDINEKLLAMPKGRTIYLEAGVYYISEFLWHIPSDTTVYMEGGVIIRGGIVLENVENVQITGRGMIYQAHFERFSGTGGIRISHSRNIMIDHLMFVNPPHYSVYLGQSSEIRIQNVKSFSCEGWGDGIDMMSCQDITVDGGFLRTSDDCVAIYGSRWNNRGGSRKVTIKNLTVWADVAHPLMIGTHGDYEHEGDIIEDILFENIDILEHHEYQPGYLGALAINVGDKNLARRITYRNIRIEAFEHGKILDFQVKWNPDYNPAPGKGISDVRLENIYVTSCEGEEDSMISGFDEERFVTDIFISEFYRDGKKVEAFEDAKIKIGKYANNIWIY